MAQFFVDSLMLKGSRYLIHHMCYFLPLNCPASPPPRKLLFILQNPNQMSPSLWRHRWAPRQSPWLHHMCSHHTIFFYFPIIVITTHSVVKFLIFIFVTSVRFPSAGALIRRFLHVQCPLLCLAHGTLQDQYFFQVNLVTYVKLC